MTLALAKALSGALHRPTAPKGIKTPPGWRAEIIASREHPAAFIIRLTARSDGVAVVSHLAGPLSPADVRARWGSACTATLATARRTSDAEIGAIRRLLPDPGPATDP
jgi:hypothetical protein